ncbi:hypothetical protein NEMIN01_1888 [Nematocida minor]|uniref:uncharacterized protein n=1 Tax=Nematocida minor TaxID=1912983 RepID=UPI002220F07E|nr:uncharacterized protein NEMIN01_1888 [Nematocida minor]KAI5192219.1 hypothetical protein NEMIN01_1888 [Nematocida minor]
MTFYELQNIKDFNGEPVEYEEYFRRLLEEIRASEIDADEIKTKLFSLLVKERSSTVIECTIKVLHSLDIEIMPSRIRPLMEIGDVLKVYAIHILHPKIKKEVEEETEEWAGLVSALFKAEIFISAPVLKMASKLSAIPIVKTIADEFIDAQLSINSIRLSSTLLDNPHYSRTESARLSKMFGRCAGAIGDMDTFISQEASHFLLSYYQKIRMDGKTDKSSFYERIKSVQNSNSLHFRDKSCDNYIRDIYTHLPERTKEQLKQEIAKKEPQCINSILDIPNMPVHTISKKTVRHVLSQETAPEESHEIALSLTDDYYKDKDLSHLFTTQPYHSNCVEY